jgi:hypothetical protein
MVLMAEVRYADFVGRDVDDGAMFGVQDLTRSVVFAASSEGDE